MPKISVILPVYNGEEYLAKSINSILMQKMQDFELIVVDDGSTDNSKQIIDTYLEKEPKKVIYYRKQNGGLSDARNFGIRKAKGDYLCFVDADDYIDKNLFENLENYISKNIDLIKYKCVKLNENYKEIEKIDGPIFECKNGEEAFNELYSNDVLLETAWLYLFRREFFIENNLQFPKDKYHEDWAIVPYSIVLAKTVVSTNIYGYYYVQSSNSITRNNDDEKIYKRAKDMLEHYDYLIQKITTGNFQTNTVINFKIYLLNCLILKLEELPKKYHKQFIKEIKERKIIQNIKVINLKQFIKKIILKINIKLYLKIRKI